MNFKKAIEAKRRAAKAAPPPPKPVSEMSEQELDAEEARLQGEIRCHKEQAVQAGRETVESGRNQAKFLFAGKRRNRRPWK